MKIGLTLSGGGVRATVFHLGVLARLAIESRLEDISFVSTVSGGSLCAGLVYARNKFGWPTSREFLEQVLPQARELLTTRDLERALIWSALRAPLSLFQARANTLSKLLQEHWGLTANLADLPDKPRWLINTTCYETGKNWRFESFRIGDYAFGYTYDTQVPVSDAVAASAGFPGLIGALTFDTRHSAWFKYTDRTRDTRALFDQKMQAQVSRESVEPAFSPVHLWDGGVYDNFGLEGVFDLEKGWRQGIDFLVVSDASGKPKPELYQPGVRALHRIITGVMMDQIRSLRVRAFLERVNIHDDLGALVEMGNTCADIFRQANRPNEIERLSGQCLDQAEADAAANTPTTIRQLSTVEFDRLFRHGYETADCTLYAYYADKFKYFGYAALKSGKM